MNKRKLLMYIVLKECRRFRRRILKKEKKEIWDSCHIIFFYCNIFEYFMYNENILEEKIEGLLKLKNPIGQLWDLYLKEEHTNVSSWRGIDDLTEVLLQGCIHKIPWK